MTVHKNFLRKGLDFINTVLVVSEIFLEFLKVKKKIQQILTCVLYPVLKQTSCHDIVHGEWKNPANSSAIFYNANIFSCKSTSDILRQNDDEKHIM